MTLALINLALNATADAVDIAAFLDRVPGERSMTASLILVTLLMLINYILNVLVIGIPALRAGTLMKKQILIDIIWFTLLAQVVDRLGGILGLLVSEPIARLLDIPGEGSWGRPFIAATLVFSGIGIALMTLCFWRRRWRLGARGSITVSVAAGVLTNPAWVLLAALVSS